MQHTIAPALNQFIIQMPKVELHLHLEGSIRPATLLAIAQRNGIELPARDEAGVVQLFQYRNFSDFLTVFTSLARALTRGEDFEQIAYELGNHLADQRVLYAEVMISPSQYYNRGLDLDEIVQGAAAGFDQVQAERGIHINLVFDYGRQFGLDDAWRLLDVAIHNMPHSVVGWSIGGDEANFPPELYTQVFEAAQRAGLQTAAHAGEVVGPRSIWSAVDLLKAKRIGHGIRSIDDPALIEHLIEQGVVLDVCPSSNLYTGVTDPITSHPLRQLLDAGVGVTLNTDDPVFFHTTLTDEYRLAANVFGCDAEELSNIVLNAAQAAFLPVNEKRALVNHIERRIEMLRCELDV
ncbi:MAG: adenosine deaminase [Chloroflexota bacterium]